MIKSSLYSDMMGYSLIDIFLFLVSPKNISLVHYTTTIYR
jgi:hypothetical protein